MQKNQEMEAAALTGSGAFLSGSEMQLLKTRVWSKCALCVCFASEDHLLGGGGLKIEEKSEFVDRCCIWWCVPCLQKESTWNITQNNSPQLSIRQERHCVTLKGLEMEIKSPQGQVVGHAGLPCDALFCNMSHGCIFCVGGTYTACASCQHRYPPGFRHVMNGLSCYTCCCNGCRTEPVLLRDETKAQILYKIEAPFLQLGTCCYWCCCPVKECHKQNLELIDARSPGQPTPILVENEAEWYLACCRSNHKFTIHFPSNASVKDKQVIFGGIMSLFAMYYDN